MAVDVSTTPSMKKDKVFSMFRHRRASIASHGAAVDYDDSMDQTSSRSARVGVRGRFRAT